MNRPGGTRPTSNLTKSEGVLTEARSSNTLFVGGGHQHGGHKVLYVSSVRWPGTEQAESLHYRDKASTGFFTVHINQMFPLVMQKPFI